MKRLVVIGGGESGTGAALLAKKQGLEVFLSDQGHIDAQYKKMLIEYQINFEEGQHSLKQILQADEVIKSPGIHWTAPLLQEIRSHNLPIVSELVLARRYTQARIIAITGSNGKTTTSMLTHQLLKDGGLRVGLAGNVGRSFAREVAESDFDHYVLEMSSFQLDDSQGFRPDIAVLLNIKPDHLDRYEGNFEHYIDAKFQITAHQHKNDFFIYNDDDLAIRGAFSKHSIKARCIPFSLEKGFEQGAYLEDQKIVIRNRQEILSMKTEELSLQGRHNVYNAMAAGLAAQLVKIRKESIKRSLADFKSVEHRLELVLKIHGIQFINDSKATNVNSVFYALENMNSPTVWIAGGQDKGNDYTELISLVKKKVKALVCLGLDNRKLIDTFKELIDPIIENQTMKEAVRSAYMLGRKGDNVLLSPACSSFDLFKNYEDRGQQFKEEVKNL
ncbi:MAG: UDP-N-acetylmuramoyl-L-alanine--D-glutamate ligase [Flavobacteriales bacterium AspAUS03]